MRRRGLLLMIVIIGCLGLAGELAAQTGGWPSALDQSSYGIPSQRRGPGAYFAWYKLLSLAAVYFPWVAAASLMNRDMLRWGKDLQMFPEVWNLLNVLACLIGFMFAISFPWFWAGFPIFAVVTWTTPTVYWLVRRSRIRGSEKLKFKLQRGEEAPPQTEVLPQDTGINLEFFAPGGGLEDQKRLILARQSPAFTALKNLVGNAVLARVDNVVLDYSTQSVRGQMLIDGTWHPLPEMDRQIGDDLLTSLKLLARLNPRDRRNRQSGEIRYKWPQQDVKLAAVQVTTQGVPTGERAVLKFIAAKTKIPSLADLGMDDNTRERLLQAMNSAGFVIISGPPRQGLTTTWRSALIAMDRMMRDCVALVSTEHDETELENIANKRFEVGQTPDTILPSVLLTHPHVFVVPDLVDRASLESLLDEVLDEKRTVITRCQATTAVEALLRIGAQVGDRRKFARAITAVSCQRLLRKLCAHCKFQVPVRPEFIQRIGGDPATQNMVYQVRQPNTVPAVDEQGKPIEYIPCQHCRGLGYTGRVAAFELLLITDELRSALAGQASAANLEQLARKAGHRNLIASAYQLVLSGQTTVAEVQRVFQEQQPART